MIFETTTKSLGPNLISLVTTTDRPRTRFLTANEPFRLAFWNVRTVNPDTKPGCLESVIRILQSYKIEIAAISEARLTGAGSTYVDNYEVFFSGKEKRCEACVALVVSKQAKRSMLEFVPMNERILKARFESSQSKLTVVAAYAPTNDSGGDTKDSFYSDLNDILNTVPEHDVLVVCGDFSAKLVVITVLHLMC